MWEENPKVLIINTGGTYNKRYNKLNGELEVSGGNEAVDEILKTVSRGNGIKSNYKMVAILSKDSLDITDEDRQVIVETILFHSDYDRIIIIHGTDTMFESAEFLTKSVGCADKKIMFVGAMYPYEIDKIEATFNLAMGLGYLVNMKDTIAISMNGYVGNYKNVKKNKINGYFEYNLLD